MTAPAAPLEAEERAVLETLGRASIYRLLGAAFAYPGPDRLPGIAALARVASGNAPAEVAGAIERFAQAAAAADPPALAQEHVFLFDRGARCPPHEGAWGVPQPAGRAVLLADIAGFHAAFGMTPAGAQPDMEDHVAAECELVSALLVKEAWAQAHGETERREIARGAAAAFVADHLGRWAGAFAAALRESTTMPYYAAAADLLEAWVSADAARLGVRPTPAEGRPDAAPWQDAEGFTCPMTRDEAAEGPP